MSDAPMSDALGHIEPGYIELGHTELGHTELDGQHGELLPARTVLSTFVQGSDGGVGANGLDKFGGVGIGLPVLDKIFPGAGNAVGGAGQSANGS